MTHNSGDERVDKASDRLVGDSYFLFLAMALLVTAIQLFFERSLIAYLPAMVGGAGSLIFLLARYASQGMLFNRQTDERIAATKSQIKTQCAIWCLWVYVIGGVVLLLLEASPMVLLGTLATWFLPALVITVRIIRRGLFATGSRAKTNTALGALAKRTLVGALCFGTFTTFLSPNRGDLFSLSFLRQVLLSGALWGIFFFAAFAGLLKISDKIADKRLRQEAADGDDE